MTDQTTTAAPARRRLGPLMAVYLLGIFMGAIDTGIVTPGRTIIQNDLGVSDQLGIWMITIYTLAYAASIPVMGKLADRFGRKPIYLLSITLFGLGSLLCGLSQDFASFEMLIVARAIQAIGGGGILPIATAEFGTSVPPEKRGMALGLVGGVYGVANIFGSSAGSFILDLAGSHNWQFIFYINVPISVAIIVAGMVVLPNHKVEQVAKIDLLGITILVAMILALLYGISNLDFLDFAASITSTDVYPYLLGFLLLLPLFVLAERRAQDPVLNLGFFTDFAIGVTLLLSFLSGVILMGVVFVPQFAENSLGIPSGDGGYFVIILGLFSGIGAPLSGRLTDRFGPKLVLGFGMVASAVAAAVGVLWAIPAPSWASVSTTLALMGLGLGFTIGSPLNYMMLERTRQEESNSALAALSLVRSVGTTLAPAFLVGFLAFAGSGLQGALVDLLPRQVSAPQLPYAAELQQKFEELKADERIGKKLAGVEFPDTATATTVQLDLGGGEGLPEDLVELLRTADVTTITERTKIVAERMFALQTPAVVADIQQGLDTGVASLDDAAKELRRADAKLRKAVNGVNKGIAGMKKAVRGMRTGIAGMTKAIDGQTRGIDGMARGLRGIDTGIRKVDADIADLKRAIAGVEAAYAAIMDALPPGTPEPPPAQELREKLEGLEQGLAGARQGRKALIAERSQLRAKRDALVAARATVVAKRSALSADLRKLEGKLAAARKDRAELVDARGELKAATADLADTRAKLVTMRAAVPGAFEEAKADYLARIDALAPRLERIFAATLNGGFANIYLATIVAAGLGALLVLAYPRRRPSDSPQAVS